MSGCLSNVFGCCSPGKESEINVENKNKLKTFSPNSSKTKEMTNNKNTNSFSSFTFSKPTTAKSRQQNQTHFFDVDSIVLSTISFQSTSSFNQSGMSSLRFYYEDDSDDDKKKAKNKLKPPKTKIIYKTK